MVLFCHRGNVGPRAYLAATQVRIWVTWVRLHTWCPQEHYRCVPDFPGCDKICEISLCVCETRIVTFTQGFETNVASSGGVSSWIAIIQHQSLTLTTEITISCQLPGLCQWLWLCGYSKGEPAETAHCILAERFSASKNIYKINLNEVVTWKRKAQKQSQKQGQDGHNHHKWRCSLSLLSLSHTHMQN